METLSALRCALRPRMHGDQTLGAVIAILVVVAVVAGVSGCSLPEQRRTVERKVERFHRQLDTGFYDDIYAEADDEFRKNVSEADSRAYLAAIHRKLGDVKSAEVERYFVSMTPTGATVSLEYETKFALGEATESFVYAVNGERATLVGYNINSPTLITK